MLEGCSLCVGPLQTVKCEVSFRVVEPARGGEALEDYFLPDSMPFVDLDLEPIWGSASDIPENVGPVTRVGVEFFSLYKVEDEPER